MLEFALNEGFRPNGPGVSACFGVVTPNIWLRSEMDPHCVLGRPVVYGLVDEWGKFFYSLTFSITRPTWPALALALETALVNKVEYCSRYGIGITQAEWPVQFLPERILLEVGAGKIDTDSVVGALGVVVTAPSPQAAVLRHMLERHFPIINSRPVNWVAGVPQRPPHCYGDWDKNTVFLTPREFQALLIRCVLHCHGSVLKGFRFSPQMLKAGVQARPSELLNWGMANITGRPRSHSLADARRQLLPRTNAVVTPDGIRHNGLHFTCKLAVREHWFEKAHLHGNRKVRLAYDPRLVDRIFLVLPNHKVEACELTSADSRFLGWTWVDVAVWRQKSQRHSQN